jgi:hypothetical protein
MDIPINAEVSCTDGVCGETICVIVEPVSEQITHVVIADKLASLTEHLVPLDQVVGTTSREIRLLCTHAELAAMPNFVERQFERIPLPFIGYPPEHYMVWPYVIADGAGMVLTSIRHERIPANELALHRGSWVEAVDGHIGEVDEFIIDPADGHITHLILRKGHFWGHIDMSIPVTQIDRIEADTIYLKLNKHAIGQLPPIAIQRRA